MCVTLLHFSHAKSVVFANCFVYLRHFWHEYHEKELDNDEVSYDWEYLSIKVLMKKSASWESVYLTMNWLKPSSTTQSRHHSHLLSWNLNLQNVSVSVPKSSQVKTSQDIFIPRIFRHALWHTISAGAKHFTAIHITPSCDRECVHAIALSARMHKWTERTNIRTNDALTDFYAHILIWLHSHAWR